LEALGPEGSLVLGAGIGHTFVMPGLVKKLRQPLLSASGKVGPAKLRVGGELSVESGKVDTQVRAGVIAANRERGEQVVGDSPGVAKWSHEGGLAVGGSAAKAQASKLEAPASLGPLFVVRGEARKSRESVPDFVVEALQRLLLQVGRDGAHAMGQLTDASTIAQETSSNLGVIKFSQAIEELWSMIDFVLNVGAAKRSRADGSAKELKIPIEKDSAFAVAGVFKQGSREKSLKVGAGIAARQDKLTFAQVELEAQETAPLLEQT
jgi:hypothetical protein